MRLMLALSTIAGLDGVTIDLLPPWRATSPAGVVVVPQNTPDRGAILLTHPSG